MYQEALEQAKKRAVDQKKAERELSLKIKDTRLALEKEIQRQLIEQLKLRAKNKTVTPDHQALIEKLYIDLRLINADLAFSTLKSFAIYEAKKRASEQSKPITGKAELNKRQEAHRQLPPQPKQMQVVQPQLKTESQHVKISTGKPNTNQHRTQQVSFPQHVVKRSQEQTIQKPQVNPSHPNSRSHPNLHAHHPYYHQPLQHLGGQSHQYPQDASTRNRYEHNTLFRSASKPNQEHPQELVHNRGSIFNSNSTQKPKSSNATKPITMPDRYKANS